MVRGQFSEAIFIGAIVLEPWHMELRIIVSISHFIGFNKSERLETINIFIQ